EEEFLLRFCLGKAYFWNGDYLNTNLILQACHQYYASADDPLMLGNVLYMLGYTAFQRSFFDQADSFYVKAIECFREAGSNGQLAATYHMMGILAYRTGRYSPAEDCLRQAHKYFRKVDNCIGIAESYIAGGRVKMYLGDLPASSEMMRKGYEISEKTGYRRGMALAGEFLGEIGYLGGDYDQSRAYLVEAEKLALEMSPAGDVTMEVCRRLGDLYLALGKFDEASVALARALELSKQLNDDHELGCVLRALALLEAARGRKEFALSYFGEAISTLKIIKESFELARTYKAAAEVYSRWASEPEMIKGRNEELLDLARTSAAEAAHLYDSLELSQDAAACEKMAARLLSDRYGERAPSRRIGVKFDDRWLHEGFLIARSNHMKEVVSKAVSLAPSTIPVLVTGETGTGKEVVARLIHKLSSRPTGKFVAVNCASVSDTVFESEIFGHRKGSFTGADRDHVGLIEQASGGTFFLDEISELTISQQAKLLRVFQEHKIRRVGESKERRIDIRLISASNQNIENLLRTGRLRKDFYYRILTASIELEPLRRRNDDVEALFLYHLERAGYGGKVEEGVLEFLKSYHWPGNVRQLISVVRVLSLIGKDSGIIRKIDLPLKIRTHHILGEHHGTGAAANILKTREIPSIGLVRDREEIRQLIISSLVKCNGNKSSTARELGVSRSTLYRALKSLGID
ncbi:MAG TPA: sigma 54-interacting transcriptional regulator, partial [Patescibacteria group bacterium]|nr:sigma 54-interacting transcriptional regulator [Patescibacteria group bacterium]